MTILGKILPTSSCSSFQPSLKYEQFTRRKIYNSQRHMGLAVKEIWDLSVNQFFPSLQNSVKGAPEKSKGPIQAKLSSTNTPLISWLSVWPRPGGGRAPTASESQHCSQPFRGNRVSTFPQPSWLPVRQLVRKLLQTHTDIWRVYPLAKQNLSSKACSKCKGTRLDQNRTGSRNSPLRK